jgi:TolB-like protein
MNRLIGMCSVLLILFLGQGWAHAAYEKTTIAIADFDLQGEGFETDDMGAIVAEWLITALVKEGRFKIIERRLLTKILGEHQLVMTGVVDENLASKLGKLYGVEVIISGTVIRTSTLIEINARIMDVASASILMAERVDSPSEARLEPLIEELAKKIIKDFPLEGYIVYRTDAQVKIDLGAGAGVKPDMQFIVFKEGSPIKHPITGAVLDVERVETGTILIHEVNEKYAEGTILSETSAGAIEYGQRVKSHVSPRPEHPSPVGPPVFGPGRLFVNASPEHARIRILNIKPPYQRGIELEPGNYHIEVSAPGYDTKTEWLQISIQESKSIDMALNRVSSARVEVQSEPPTPTPSPTLKHLPSQVTGYIQQLRSSNPVQQRNAAKSVYRSPYRSHPEILKTTNEELLKGHNRNGQNKYHIDAMAWLCNILGESGNRTYAATLKKVTDETQVTKIKKYAQKNYRRLK